MNTLVEGLAVFLELLETFYLFNSDEYNSYALIYLFVCFFSDPYSLWLPFFFFFFFCESWEMYYHVSTGMKSAKILHERLFQEVNYSFEVRIYQYD